MKTKIAIACDDVGFDRKEEIKKYLEEEKNAEDLIKKFELFGSDPKGLYALNQELLARVYMAPSLVL